MLANNKLANDEFVYLNIMCYQNFYFWYCPTLVWISTLVIDWVVRSVASLSLRFFIVLPRMKRCTCNKTNMDTLPNTVKCQTGWSDMFKQYTASYWVCAATDNWLAAPQQWRGADNWSSVKIKMSLFRQHLVHERILFINLLLFTINVGRPMCPYTNILI